MKPTKITQNNFIINRNFFQSQNENSLKAYILTRMAYAIQNPTIFPYLFEEIDRVIYLKDILFDVKRTFIKSSGRQNLWKCRNQLEKGGFIIKAKKYNKVHYTLTAKSWDIYKMTNEMIVSEPVVETITPEVVEHTPEPVLAPTPVPEPDDSELEELLPPVEEVKEPIEKETKSPIRLDPKIKAYFAKERAEKAEAERLRKEVKINEPEKMTPDEHAKWLLEGDDGEDIEDEDMPDLSIASELRKTQIKMEKQTKEVKSKPYKEPRDLSKIDEEVKFEW